MQRANCIYDFPSGMSYLKLPSIVYLWSRTNSQFTLCIAFCMVCSPFTTNISKTFCTVYNSLNTELMLTSGLHSATLYRILFLLFVFWPMTWKVFSYLCNISFAINLLFIWWDRVSVYYFRCLRSCSSLSIANAVLA